MIVDSVKVVINSGKEWSMRMNDNSELFNGNM